ncbi:hypothetical protein [Rhodococcus opacus]|uniref:hypothetical protein n=1 Tax=Rhodococcus opacus TaxID=37919 RepID=UPI0034D1C8DA
MTGPRYAAIAEVDQVFLDNATVIWQIGRAVPLPGLGGRVRTESDFLPTPVTRMFLWHITDYQPSPGEEQEWAAHTSRRRSAAGPATKYQLEWFRLDTPSSGGRGRLPSGDVLLYVTADNEWIHPPAVVDSDPISVPHTRNAVAYLLRTRIDLDPIAVPDAETQLADLGHPHLRLRPPDRLPQPAGSTAPPLEPLTVRPRASPPLTYGNDTSLRRVSANSAAGRLKALRLAPDPGSRFQVAGEQAQDLGVRMRTYPSSPSPCDPFLADSDGAGPPNCIAGTMNGPLSTDGSFISTLLRPPALFGRHAVGPAMTPLS